MFTLMKWVMKLANRVSPLGVRKAINAQVLALESISEATGGQDASRAVELVTSTQPNQCAPRNESVIVPKLIDSYVASTSIHSPAAYTPARDWKRILDTEWRDYRKDIEERDIGSLAKKLRNFFRNEALSGFWGDTNMFATFVSQKDPGRSARASLMFKQYSTWRELFPNVGLEALGAPSIGNPWGYSIDGTLLYEPVFEYHYHASYINSLIGEIETPTVLEIGGGFGGLAYHLLRRNRSIKYIGLDLPENALLQAYYLLSAFPDLRVLTFGPDMPAITRETLAEYDAIILPNFCLPEIENALCDVVVNIRSFGEMSIDTLREYFAQIERISPLWIFHENIYKARDDQFFGVPSTDFPVLNDYLLVAASRSRWPRYETGIYPCQENLFINRRALSSRSLG